MDVKPSVRAGVVALLSTPALLSGHQYADAAQLGGGMGRAM